MFILLKCLFLSIKVIAKEELSFGLKMILTAVKIIPPPCRENGTPALFLG